MGGGGWYLTFLESGLHSALDMGKNKFYACMYLYKREIFLEF